MTEVNTSRRQRHILNITVDVRLLVRPSLLHQLRLLLRPEFLHLIPHRLEPRPRPAPRTRNSCRSRRLRCTRVSHQPHTKARGRLPATTNNCRHTQLISLNGCSTNNRHPIRRHRSRKITARLRHPVRDKIHAHRRSIMRIPRLMRKRRLDITPIPCHETCDPRLIERLPNDFLIKRQRGIHVPLRRPRHIRPHVLHLLRTPENDRRDHQRHRENQARRRDQQQQDARHDRERHVHALRHPPHTALIPHCAHERSITQAQPRTRSPARDTPRHPPRR